MSFAVSHLGALAPTAEGSFTPPGPGDFNLPPIGPHGTFDFLGQSMYLGITKPILGKYSFNDQWALAARAEVIKSTGSMANGAPSLLYGPGSGAWSLTLTPTWQKGIFFARVEGSYVHAWHVTPGFGLGPNFNDKSQVRGLIEAGVAVDTLPSMVFAVQPVAGR